MKTFTLAFLTALLLFGLPDSLKATPVVSGPATVELISETAYVVPGQTFFLALHFKLEPHWHIYWKNPGASGLPVDIEWTLPEGFQPGAIQWPAPQRIELGGLISYAFEGEVMLMVPVQAPETWEYERTVEIVADASWLICKELCLPGSARLELELQAGKEPIKSATAPLFGTAREQLPQTDLPWSLSASADDATWSLKIEQMNEVALPNALYFYAEEEGVIDPNAIQEYSFLAEGTALLKAQLATEQLGKPLTAFSGVLQSGDKNWWVEGSVAPATERLTDPAAESFVLSTGELPVLPAVESSSSGGFEDRLLKMGLAGWLLLAFTGGLILNLMPCVLPVLSLKVFSLLKHSGQSRAQALLHGSAYTVGVVLSFLALAGVLLSLRALGEQVGWGFQLQNPSFIAILAVALFLFALNLMGVFEIGVGLVGADDKLSGRNDVLGSLGMGVLAAVVGSPCIGPFLASVSGIAIQSNTLTSLSIFGTMGLGLAAPFLLLSIFPNLVAYLPKPGAWMETLKQFMGFLLMATVVFLLFVAGQLGEAPAIIGILTALLLAALAAWIYGRWSVPTHTRGIQRAALAVGLLLLLSAFFYATRAVNRAYASLTTDVSSTAVDEDWAPWSAARVEDALAAGKPVFIDFTASWCLICQANKATALRTEATQALFADYEVVTFEADWTRRDAAITRELERFGRSGVPLYVLYAPDGQATVLPQNLTNRKIREAVEKTLK